MELPFMTEDNSDDQAGPYKNTPGEIVRPFGSTSISLGYLIFGLYVISDAAQTLIRVLSFGFSTQLSLFFVFVIWFPVPIAGCFMIVEAYGIWQGFRWAKDGLLIFSILISGYFLFVFLMSHLIIYFAPMLVNVLVIYYIRSDGVARYFGRTDRHL
jgi:hypothetical protein